MPWAVSTTPLDNLFHLLADLPDLHLPNLWIIDWVKNLMKMIAFPWKNAQIWNLYTKYPKGHRHPCSCVSICSALLTSCMRDIQLPSHMHYAHLLSITSSSPAIPFCSLRALFLGTGALAQTN